MLLDFFFKPQIVEFPIKWIRFKQGLHVIPFFKTFLNSREQSSFLDSRSVSLEAKNQFLFISIYDLAIWGTNSWYCLIFKKLTMNIH